MNLLRNTARTLALALAILGCSASVRAASVPTGFQEYRVLGHEEHVYDMFQQHVTDAFAFGYSLSNAMLSVVSVTASTDNQVITYEHWEDGSQLVLGDGVPGNGDACNFIPGATCPGDAVKQGDTLIFASTGIPGTVVAPNCASGGTSDCVPIPRMASDVRFDGGDRIVSSGGPITLVHVQEPVANQAGRLGGAVEVLPLQAVRNASSYSVPVGEDTYANLGGSNSPGEPFRRVHLNLVAFEDNTSVQVTSPLAGTVNFTLQNGEHWSSQGAIDAGAGPALTINEGTKVSVNKPVAGLIFASSDSAHATRMYALLPDLLHGNDYVITAPGDNPAVNGNRDHDVYVYNPSPTSSISVTATDSIGPNTFNVPANSVVAYSIATGRAEMPANSTVRLTSAANFWGISAYDRQTTAVDWGHSWLATDFLAEVYTIPYAPDNPSRTTNPPDPSAAPGTAQAGATPAFVAATADNTCVRIDFDNDGAFDRIRDGAGDEVTPSGGTCGSNGYLIDALEALRIYDNNAADGTQNNDISGARIEANKPIAMSYGLDSDSAPSAGTGILDLGYAIYPADERFLNPVLTVDKEPDRNSVPAVLPPGQGTIVTYTLEVRAYDSAPLTALSVTDLLPSQVSGGACVNAAGPGSGYVCNGTTITYPDLSTETGAAAEPTLTPGVRDLLTWDAPVFAPKSDALQKNEVLLINYQVRVEAGASTVLRNDTAASAALGSGSTFSPTAFAEVVRTDVTLSKAVTDDGTPEAGDLVTYTLTVTNNSTSTTETGVSITDPLPASMTFETGTVTSSLPGITGNFSDGQNAVEWTGTLLPGESAVLSFQASINSLAASGTAIDNFASYESDQTSLFDSNTVTTTVVGPELAINKIASGNPNPVHTGEIVTYEITVDNVGAGTAEDLLIQDPIQVNGTYKANSLEWRLNAGAFQPLSDAFIDPDTDDEGGGANGLFTANQAEFRLAELAPGQDITFRFKVTVTGTAGNSIGNQATVSSKEVQPADTPLVQIPIVNDGTIITVDKGSDAPPSGVAPGNTVTYSVQVSNTSGVNQSNVTVTDPVPTGTSVVGSTQVSAPPIRVTEYFLDTGTGQFTGTTFNLALSQDLQPNYYVIIQGSAGDGTVNGNRGPGDNYARLSADPFGTGELAVSGGSNVISLARGSAPEDWVGVVTVVESLPNAGDDGFILRDVREVSHAGAGTTGFEDITGTWTLAQTLLMGGYNGAGCSTAEAATANTKVCHARIFPTGTQRINWTRNAGGATLSVATSTVMAVEWGANWTVQRVRVQGGNGGNGADAAGEYNTAAIAAANRDNTWVWGTGHTNDQGIGDASEGVLVTLGNGVTQNASETSVAVGLEYAGNAVDFEVYALSHPELAVDYRFKADGDTNSAQVNVTVDAQPFNRMALASNGQNGTGNAYPRPMFSARYTAPGTVLLERRRTGQAFPAWVQGISFAGMSAVSTGGAQPNLASGYELPPGSSLTVTYQVMVDDPLAGGITQISNTATATSSDNPGGESDTLNLNVVRPAVSVEANSAGSVIDDGTDQSIDFLHSVTNVGAATDSFDLNVFSDSGYRIDLIDPATGVVIATDSDGDGNWDGGAAPNTGSLAPGASSSYIIRVTVPTGSTVPGDSDRVEFRATSDAGNSVTGSAFDEVLVVDGSFDGEGDVVVTPDNASFADAGSRVAYTHTVSYLAGSPNDPDPMNPPARAFALQANTGLPGWTATIYQDTNNDGIYTDGVDTAITSTSALNAGDSQRVFVVVDVPGGAGDGDVDQTTLTASFFNDGGTPSDVSDDISLGGTATDTTTVGDEPNNSLGFTVSGGGTQVVGAGDTATYPGELGNLGTNDVFEFTISPSVYADGLNPPPNSNQPDDGLPHTTELWLDTDGDGDISDELTPVAVDTDGDGIWDLIDVNGDGTFDTLGVDTGPFDQDGDGNPDIAVLANAMTPFELRRPVDASQGPYSDPVTLSVTSVAGGRTDAITVTTSVQAVTMAVVDTLQAFMVKGRAYVQWSTRSEHGTVGFTLERLDERRDRWLKVNSRLLPALLHSRHGGVYRLRDRRARLGQTITYRLSELEATGAIIQHGPYTVVVSAEAPDPVAGHEDVPLPGYQRVARAIDALSRERAERKISARLAAALQRSTRRGPVIKMTVTETGMYRVSAARIGEAMGESEDTVRRLIKKNRLQVLNKGRRVTTHAPDDTGLMFFGEAPESPYTNENVYVLRRGNAYRMPAISARTPVAEDGQTQAHTAHAEGNSYYLTHLFDDPDGDYWMWDFRYEDMIFDSYESQFLVETPGAASSGTATVTVRFHGGLEALHRARVTLVGAAADAVNTEWEGLTPHTLSFPVDASALAGEEVRLEITGLGSGDPSRPSTFYINDVDIQYTRRNVAHDGALTITHTPRQVSTMDGFESHDVMVFDITNPQRVQRLSRLTLEDTPEGVRVSVNPSNRSLRRLLAVEPTRLLEPVSLVADTPSLLKRREHSVDWLLITSYDMLDAAEILADHRRGQGLRVMVVDIEDVYDEFAHGVRDADAIWRLLNHAHRRWRVAPRYVVLAGEGSFDYKDYLGHGDSIIPTLLAPTADGLFPSDNLFADVAGNDFLPEMAIGRLPVIDADELAAVAAKIIAYEASAGDWTDSVVFGADPKDLGGDFATSSARVINAVPAETVARETLNVDPDRLPMAAARARLHESLNEGRAFLNFFGHAATGSLGNLAPGLINAGDLMSPSSTLDNGDNLPVVTAFTCLVGQFGVPGADGVGELLLITPDRGAAAVYSPSGLSRNLLSETLGEGFYRSTYGDGVLVIGDAILGTQAHYNAAGGELYLLDIYNLLGDPATIMK